MNLYDDIIDHDWHDVISELKENKMNTPNKAQQYDRFHKTYTLEEVLPFISRSGKKLKREYDGNLVKMFSLRLRTFLIHGTVCVNCGLCGQYFALERHLPASHYLNDNIVNYHFNLYGKHESGEEILFTKDHIIPRSKRGPDSIKNMQTMCITCNHNKGDSLQ